MILKKKEKKRLVSKTFTNIIFQNSNKRDPDTHWDKKLMVQCITHVGNFS